MPQPYTAFLEALNPSASTIFGGKAINLAKLHKLDVKVPAGFAISTQAFTRFLQQITRPELLQRIRTQDLEATLEKAAAIRESGQTSPVPADVVEAIITSCERLERRIGHAPAGYAVRSSATVEDTAQFSFAGQADSFLCIQGIDNIVKAVKQTWLSAFSPRAVFYLHSKGVPLQKVQMGVVVQEMIPADVSGVMFTANVVTGDTDQLLIDVTWGLGETIVSGKVTPDSFVLHKQPLQIIHRTLGGKKTISTPYPPGSPEGTRLQATPEDQRHTFALTDQRLLHIAETGLYIERQLGRPQDIEFCLKAGTLIILQTRPITTL